MVLSLLVVVAEMFPANRGSRVDCFDRRANTLCSGDTLPRREGMPEMVGISLPMGN
jgi:hypothetical protein